MKYNYAVEKLGSAVLYAMRSDEPLQERLHGCYVIFHPLGHHHDYLPPDLKERFDTMIDSWTRMPDPDGRGTVAATTEKMDDTEARKWLEEVFSLYSDIVERETLDREKARAATK